MMNHNEILRYFNVKPLPLYIMEFLSSPEGRELSNRPTFERNNWLESIYYKNASPYHKGFPAHITYAIETSQKRFAILFIVQGLGGIIKNEKINQNNNYFVSNVEENFTSYVISLIDIGVEFPRPLVKSMWIYEKGHPRYNSDRDIGLEVENENEVKDAIKYLIDETDKITFCPSCKVGVVIDKYFERKENTFRGCNRYPYCQYIEMPEESHGIKPQKGDVVCPVCGSAMAVKVAKRGKNKGKTFWGCTAFPKCRKTLAYNSPEIKRKGE